MAMSVVYGNAFGGIVSENRGGTVSTYVPDTLGSTIGLIDSAGTVTDSWAYWPYGEVRTRTGTTATPFSFVGTLGYFLDTLSKLFYVRARHFRSDLARWPTVDLLWPLQMAYAYVGNVPVQITDESGLTVVPAPGMGSPPPNVTKPIGEPCTNFLTGPFPFDIRPYLKCLQDLGPQPSPTQIEDCFDKLPNKFKTTVLNALCNFLACEATSPAGYHPGVDACTLPDQETWGYECCLETYLSNECKCIANNANNVGLGFCLDYNENKLIDCVSRWA